MLRLFQVNEGRYVDVEGELTPNSRVGDVSESVRSVEGGGGGVVLMVADGRQMEPTDLVAGYAAGMENKPIFVFYQSYLSSPSPPSLPTHLKPRLDLERGMSVLTQKPSPVLFQKLPPLAKQLSEYSITLYNIYLSVSEECDLQIAGWMAVLRNCKRIIGLYQKHQQHFSHVVSSFQSSRPHYLVLVHSFPEQVKLLQQLPIPSFSTSPPSSLSSSLSSSLYDWISTHDEKNSLVDLCSECEKALAQADDAYLTSSLAASQQLLESVSLEGLEIEEGGAERVGGVEEEAKKGAELSQLQVRMMENIQSTSQRAMRSGDGGTIADLSVSHHKSLQLMRQQCTQLEDIVRSAEARKARITQHIHKGLRVVTELQMKINESNSVLVFLHETLKLAKKRFEVLEQVCSCAEVLGNVVSEVERRQAFNQLFTERVVEVAEELRTVREEEKQRRHTFTSSHRHHFLLSLFPQLSHRLPDATCRLSRVPDTTDTTDLSRIKKSLPPQFLVPSSSEAVSLGFSCSQLMTTSTPFTSTYSQPSQLDTLKAEEGSEGEKEMDQALAERLKWEEERNKLVNVVQQLQEQLATKTAEGELQTTKDTESQTIDSGREMAEAVQKNERENKELTERIQQLQFQIDTLTTERDHLMKETETCHKEREKERKDLSERLQESEAMREQLATTISAAQQEKLALEGQVEMLKEEVANRERKWEEEKCRLVAREGELLQEMEKEKQQATVQCEELQRNCTELKRQFEMSEKMVFEQKAALVDRTTELENANDARSKLNDECIVLRGRLEKKTKEVDSLNQQNMQWKGEAECGQQAIVALKEENIELMHQIEVLNNRCEYLSSENEQLKSGNLSDYRSASSEGFRSERQYHSADLQTQTEQLQSDGGEVVESNEVELLKTKQQQLETELAQFKSDNEQMNLHKKQVNSQLREQKSQLEAEKASLESKTLELTQQSQQLEIQLRQAEKQRDELQMQRKAERTKFAADIARSNSLNKELQSQLQEQLLRTDQLKSQLDHLHTECLQFRAEVEQLRTASSEVEKENSRLQMQKDTDTHTVEQLRLKVKEVEEKYQNLCIECESNLSKVSTLTKNLQEKEEELKRSESRHQQAQMAYASTKAQQEQLRLKLVALEQRERGEGREQTEGTMASSVEELRGKEVANKGKRLGEDDLNKRSKEDSYGAEESDGEWVLEGGDVDGGLEVEVKRLRTELAVERNNRSLLAVELRQVGKERDEFMQKFMEVERELRTHRHAVSQSVMSTSQSTDAGDSARASSGHQRQLSLTISNLQVDDVAMFCVDSFNNYLALCVDGKTYYLNHTCVSKFTDYWHEKVMPPFDKKLLIGRVTKRLHVEVRKEDNRLHVPVGTRLYKLEADELPQDWS